VDETDVANYDPNFNYANVVSSAQLAGEEANVSRGASWTIDQLKYAIDGGLLGETSFVILLPQTPT